MLPYAVEAVGIGGRYAPEAGDHLIGFSLGAFRALREAVRHPVSVEQITLISPAAPLELGDFLSQMAGQVVFRAAQNATALRVLTWLQRYAMHRDANKVIDMMFRGSADRPLLEDANFRRIVTEGMRQSVDAQRASYVAELLAYRRPWAGELGAINAPIRIVQGEDDTWVPPAMARALADHLGERATLEMVPDLGHYGTLIQTQA